MTMFSLFSCCCPEHELEVQEYSLLAPQAHVKTICETGFNAGHSTLLWLLCIPRKGYRFANRKCFLARNPVETFSAVFRNCLKAARLVPHCFLGDEALNLFVYGIAFLVALGRAGRRCEWRVLSFDFPVFICSSCSHPIENRVCMG